MKSLALPILKAFLRDAPEELARRLTSAADLLERARAAPAGSTLPTAVPALEGLLPGGLPRGEMVEISGLYSTGRFSLALSLLAAATEAGEAAALVDLGDHFDPQAAEAAGVSLPRLLWLRPRTLRQALLSAETAVKAGVPLVLLDLGLAPSKLSLAQRARPDVAFLRLARAARAHDTALVVLAPRRATGAAARAVLAAERARPFWHRGEREASTPLLLGLSGRLVPEKLPGHRPGTAKVLKLQMEGTISSKEENVEGNRRDPSYGRVEASAPGTREAVKAVPRSLSRARR